MKFNILVFAIFCLASQFASAQDAVDILNDVNRYYSTKKTLRAEFDIFINSETSAQNSKQTERISGTMFMKDENYHLTTKDLIRVSDGISVWTHFIDDEEILITEYDPEEEELSPAKIFSIFERGYDSRYLGQFECGEKNCLDVELLPDNEENPYQSIILTIEKDKSAIIEVLARTKNGTEMRFVLNEIEFNINLADETFIYNIAKFEQEGIEINDFR